MPSWPTGSCEVVDAMSLREFPASWSLKDCLEAAHSTRLEGKGSFLMLLDAGGLTVVDGERDPGRGVRFFPVVACCAGVSMKSQFFVSKRKTKCTTLRDAPHSRTALRCLQPRAVAR